MSQGSRTFGFCPCCGSPDFEKKGERNWRCKRCGFDFYQNVASAVAAIIIDKDKGLLTTRRGIEPQKGTLDLPGGFVEYGETAEEALQREAKEELGVKINVVRYLWSQANIYTYSGIDVHTLDQFFLCEIDGDDSLTPMDDISETKWISIEDLDENQFGLTSIRETIIRLKNCIFAI